MLGIAGHRIGDAYRSVVGSLTAASTESKFIENGTLTPEEFVQAGDQLTFKFPTWQWEAGESSRRASYLPPDKQFFITRNVPCRTRVRALDYVLEHHTRSEDEWLLPETAAGAGGAGGEEEIRDIDDINGESASGIIVAQEDFISAPDGDLPDFSDLDRQLVEEDPASKSGGGAASRGALDEAAPAFGAGGDYLVADAPDANIVRSRTYDLSITYDKYYQTPRLWLFGYNEDGEPLKPDEVYEDVLSEYVSKTVTVDPHPLTGTPTVSIHPCKHAQVMKKVVQDWIDQGITPRTDLALFVFLKFISGVVPTINYDFTMDIEF